MLALSSLSIIGSLLGCATTATDTSPKHEGSAPSPFSPRERGTSLADCRYLTIFIDRPKYRQYDFSLAERIEEVFVEQIEEHGFRVIHDRLAAYFVTKVLALQDRNNEYREAIETNRAQTDGDESLRAEQENSIIIFLRTIPQEEHRKNSIHYVPEILVVGSTDPAVNVTSTFEFNQILIKDADFTVRAYADFTAEKLLPDTIEKCEDARAGGHKEEQRLLEIRAQLVEEIERIRRERAEREKSLEIEIEQ